MEYHCQHQGDTVSKSESLQPLERAATTNGTKFAWNVTEKHDYSSFKTKKNKMKIIKYLNDYSRKMLFFQHALFF